MDQGGLGLLSEWIQRAEGPRLIIVDVLGKFRPIANDFGANPARSFTFQVQDDANINTPAGGVNLEPAAQAHTLTIGITGVNDPPVAADNTVSTREDVAYTFSSNDFNFSDPNDNPTNNFVTVTIATTPGSGSLTLNGVAVTPGQPIVVDGGTGADGDR